MSFVGKAVDSLTGGSKAAGAATAGAQISADAQREALAYLKEEEEIPQFFRKGALNVIGGLSGLGDMSGQEAVAKIKNSEIYKQVLGSRMAGEDAILRNASATGGIRGGNVQGALAQFRPNLLNQLIEAQYGKLAGLTTLGSSSAQNLLNTGSAAAAGTAAGAQQSAQNIGIVEVHKLI